MINTMIVEIKNNDFYVVPKPIIRVRIESDMNAQISEPPFNNPVT